MNRYTILSAALHVLFLFLVLMVTKGAGDGKGNGKGDGNKGTGSKYEGAKVGTVIPKETTEVTIIETEKGPAPKKKASKKRKASAKCKASWYGGIGISSMIIKGEETIEEVFPGYPADMADIVPGDIIENVIGNKILGEPGTVVIMDMKRYGVVTRKNITRGKVCY